MPAVIIEVCFCEATKDVQLYKSAGPDKIGRLIAEGVANSAIADNGSSNAPVEPSLPEGFYESNEQRTNATIVGEGNIPVLDVQGKVVPNRYVSSLDNIFVLGIYPSSNYIEIVYPSGSKKYHAYISIEHYNRISFEYHMQYQNDGGITYVWWAAKDVNVTDHNEELQPDQKASPMYREDGRLRVTFYRPNGVPSDGYVRYEGAQSERFYEEKKKQYGIVSVNTYLNVRDNINGNIIGKVFNGEKVEILWTKDGHYYIEYDTSNGKKQGYVAAQYVNKI